jgi:hypothetical protein
MGIFMMALSIVCGFLFFLGLATGTITVPSRYDLVVNINRCDGHRCIFWFMMLLLFAGTVAGGYYSYLLTSQ